MFLFMEKLLEFSIRLEMSRSRAVRIAGILIGAIPLRCAEYMEKRLMNGKWDPGRKWRRKKCDNKKIKKKTSVFNRTDV